MCTRALISFYFFLFVFSLGNCLGISEPPLCVFEAAQTGLPHFVNKIPAGHCSEYGVSSPGEIHQLKTGKPLQLFSITPYVILQNTQAGTMNDLLTPTSLWYIPVLSENRAVAMLVVEQKDAANAKAVSFGFAHLAKQISDSELFYPELITNEKRLIAVYQAQEFFLALPETHPGQLLALQSSEIVFSPLTDVFLRLQPVVEQNLEGGR
jgi:hypothetical protein